MDIIQILANGINSISDSAIKLTLVIASVGGMCMLGMYVYGQASRASRGQVTDSAGTFISVILFTCCIIALHNIVNAGAQQIGFGAVTFNAISYVPDSKYGPAAVAVNAGLTALQAIGLIFILTGLHRLRRSLKDGHTGLSSGEDMASGVKKFFFGLLLVCNPSVINALQNTFKLHW